jgi:hypothetical protein
MPIIFMGRIKREDLRNHRDWLFVFGDNFARHGLGGQAKECRGERNTVGIPTKRTPGTDPEAYLTNADIAEWRLKSRIDFDLIRIVLSQGRTVVFPSAGIGTGLARLEQCAPAIWVELQMHLDKLKADYYSPQP